MGAKIPQKGHELTPDKIASHPTPLVEGEIASSSRREGGLTPRMRLPEPSLRKFPSNSGSLNSRKRPEI